ncbi:hypothetical protein [Pseudanabaena sp. FACHB-2040]|nr:hypothetical protein [Pseudanabaena sp. FACHB-2040]
MRREASKSNRQQVIEELRHQLRYASTHEREGIRRELNFWLNNR